MIEREILNGAEDNQISKDGSIEQIGGVDR
jgi:hypothetical protein